MKSSQATRSLLLACGLAGSISLIGATAYAQSDPIAKPLWEPLGATRAAVLDSFTLSPRKFASVAFPYLPANTTINSVFTQLAPYANTRWRLGHWRPDLGTAGAYEEPGTANALTNVASGIGYWLINRDTVNVRFDGTAPSATDSFEIPLRRGPLPATSWNQVGNPFPFKISTTNWKVVKRDIAFPTASAASLIDVNIKAWDPASSGYSNVNTVKKGEAFWTRVQDTDNALAWTLWRADPLNAGSHGTFHALALDSIGNPRIAFKDGATGTLKYAARKGSGWIVETVPAPPAPASTNVGDWCSLKIDRNGNPHIAYQDGINNRLLYAKKVGTTWTREVADAAVNVGAFCSIALDPGGNPRIAYQDAANNNTKFAFRGSGGGWSQETADPLGRDWIGLALDSQGNPSITSYDATNANLRYAVKSAGVWSADTIEALGATGQCTGIAIDAQNRPHVSWITQAGSGYVLKYGTRSSTTTGAWSITQADASGQAGLYGSIAVTPQGTPSITYLAINPGPPSTFELRIATRPATSFSTEVVNPNVSTIGLPSVAVDSQGNPRVAYSFSTGTQVVRYAEKLPGTVRLLLAPIVSPEPALAAAPAKPEGSQWALAMTARQDDRAAETVVLGIAPIAANGASLLASTPAPAPPGVELLSVVVPRNDLGELNGDYVRDFRAAADRQSWDLVARGATAPGEITLDFEGYDIPAGMSFWLTDLASFTTREVRPGQSLTLAATAAPRKLRIDAAAAGVSGPRVTDTGDGIRYAYPNPFATSSGLAFSLARGGDLKVE